MNQTNEKINSPGLAAIQFGIQATEVWPMQDGLINTTLRITDATGRHFLLQKINTLVFQNPLHIQENYQQIFDAIHPVYALPAQIPAVDGSPLYYAEDGGCWRCFDFVDNSYTPKILEDAAMAHTAATCFGRYTTELTRKHLPLHTILPQFHDLNLRARQLQMALRTATAPRFEAARSLLQAADQYAWLLDYYTTWVANPQQYPTRILHHDAKVSNILFDIHSHQVICPIDLDTTQPGLFFSDLGDMVRSMVPTHNENHPEIADIDIQRDILEALEDGYRSATAHLFTPEEQQWLHLSGQVLVYMQAIRFLTDYLNNDVYYAVQYEEQNLVRAANQFRVLQLLAAK